MLRKIVKKHQSKVVKLSWLFGAVVLVVAVLGWWHFVYNSPSSVFDRMLSNMLSTSSVTKESSQVGGGQAIEQNTQILTSPYHQARTLNTLTQTGLTNSTVTTESIGGPSGDYVRYVDIKTNQLNPNGKPFDFSQLLGVWSKTPGSDQNTASQLYSQLILGVVPIGNLSAENRDHLLNEIKTKGVYDINYSTVKQSRQNGRLIYTYTVKVKPMAYVAMLKDFAKMVGLTQLEQVDPSLYQNSSPFEVNLEVDAWSGQLTRVTYSDNGRTENYQDYGAHVTISQPDVSIGVNELQSRLQQVQ